MNGLETAGRSERLSDWWAVDRRRTKHSVDNPLLHGENEEEEKEKRKKGKREKEKKKRIKLLVEFDGE